MSDGQYAFSLTTFSPSGKLVQIEHALNAVTNQGRPALGIQATDGVVIAAEKKLSSTLVDPSTIRKVEQVSDNLGILFSGMPGDFRVILARSRKEVQAYQKYYRDIMPVRQMVKDSASVMQEFTQSGGVRPFGVSLLIAGYDEEGPQLYQCDPSGVFISWKATAIGKDMANAKAFLEKRYSEEMTLEEAIYTAILTLRESFEGAMTPSNVEIGVVGADKKFRILTEAEIQKYLREIE